MNNLSKECIELLEVDAKVYAEIYDRGNYGSLYKAYLMGQKTALLTPSIYQAAGLIEATPLTDEEIEKEAEMLAEKEYNKQTEKLPSPTSLWLEEKEHYKYWFKIGFAARKMGSGWVSVEDKLYSRGQMMLAFIDGLNTHRDMLNGTIPKEKSELDVWDEVIKRINSETTNGYGNTFLVPSPPKTEVK